MRIALCLLALALSARAATPYVGESDRTTATGQDLYVMLSAYKIVPYRQSYLDNALATLGRTGIHGIVYSSVGGVTNHLRERWPADAGPAPDEVAYNTEIYRQAQALGARLWLQIPEYYNSVTVDGVPRSVTADGIINDPAAREAFKTELLREFEAYRAFAPAADRRVIVFEEAGIYHSPEGGGTFWASPHPVPAENGGRPSAAYNDIFADHLKQVFRHVRGWLKEADPHVAVGMHLGHQAVEDVSHLKDAVAWLKAHDSRPDFLFYDLYLGGQSPKTGRWKGYEKRLTDRRANLASLDEAQPIRALHLGQLHTMNNFQNGRGFTPSREELDDIMALDDRLNFDGVGYYTKNALPTDPAVSPDAYDPNAKGSTTSAESSTDRWDYGIAQLFEKTGVDYRDWFDLVLQGRFGREGFRVYAQNVQTGAWDLVGQADRSLRGNYRDEQTVVFRFLNANRYLADNRTTLNLKIDGPFSRAFIVPSQTARKFRSAASIQEDIRSGAISQYARATLSAPSVPLRLVTD